MITILGINNITTPTPRPFSLIHTRTRTNTLSCCSFSFSSCLCYFTYFNLSVFWSVSIPFILSVLKTLSPSFSLFLFSSLSLPLSLRRGWHNPLHRVPLLRLMLLSHSLTCTQCCCYRSDHFHCLLTVTPFQTGSLSIQISFHLP